MSIENTQANAYQKSLSLLHKCLSPAGFLASSTDIDNYARIWARDGVITGLAALASGDTALIEGMRLTLTTLTQHQGPHGEIPSNVTVDRSRVSYGHLVGRVDALLWYGIGVCAYIKYTNDAQAKDLFRPSIERALFLAGCWEYNNRGLIYTPLSGNWADEYIQQGYVLSDELLYRMALGSAALIYNNQKWQTKGDYLQQMLAINYWPLVSLCKDSLVYHPQAFCHEALQQAEINHWLPAFSPIGYATYFDGLAHALALITNLGNDSQRHQAEAYVQSLEQQTGSALLPAFWPPIQPGDPGWAELQFNHLYGQMKNSPYMYHNGGLWPIVTGLYALGLVHQGRQQRAKHLLNAINLANAQGRDGNQWEFSEYHHGQTLQPLGTKHLAWSAAAGVLAHQAALHNTTPWPF